MYNSIEELLPSSKKGKPGIVTPEKAGAIIKYRDIRENSSPPDEVVERMLPFIAEYGLRDSLSITMLAPQRLLIYYRSLLKNAREESPALFDGYRTGSFRVIATNTLVTVIRWCQLPLSLGRVFSRGDPKRGQ